MWDEPVTRALIRRALALRPADCFAMVAGLMLSTLVLLVAASVDGHGGSGDADGPDPALMAHLRRRASGRQGALQRQVTGATKRVILGVVSHPGLWPLLEASVAACPDVYTLSQPPASRAEFAYTWSMAIEAAHQSFGTVYLPLVAPHPLMEWDQDTALSDLVGFLASDKRVARIDLVAVREYLPTSMRRGPGTTSVPTLLRHAGDLAQAVDRFRDALQIQESGRMRVHEVRAEWLWHDPLRAKNWLGRELDLVGGPSTKRFRSDPRLRPPAGLDLGDESANGVEMAAVMHWIAHRSLEELRLLPPLPHLARWRSEEQEKLRPTRVVVITQVRNVAHTLRSFLDSVAWAADKVLLLDTGSTDGTIELVQQMASSPDEHAYRGKVAVRRCSHGVMGWNEGRSYRELLDWAREERATHVLCPDSDEYPTHNWRRHGLLRNAILGLPPKTTLSVRLFHVYDGTDRWISPSPSGWGQVERAPLGWHDDGKAHRAKRMHHIPRVPQGYRTIALHRSKTLGSVHFKFASLQAIGAKTVWYRHLEYDSGSRSRALGGFYASKIPRVGSQNFRAVSRQDWYGPGSEAWTRRWSQPESYGWRVRMVLAWRAAWRKQKRSIPKALDLPAGWPFGVALSGNEDADPGPDDETKTPARAVVHSADDLDARCRKRRARGNKAVAEILPVQEGETRFLWAVAPDRTIPRWLRNHEAHVREFARRALTPKACANGSALAIDVGANSGYYGLMALAMGCRTLFVEPQPYCGMLLEASLAANGWQDRALVLRAAAGPKDSEDQGIDVWCDTPCYGRVGAPGVGAPKGSPKQKRDGVRPMVRLANHPWLMGDEVDVAMLKIDVEGAEAGVLEGLWPLFERGAVRAATVEVTPMFYRQRRKEREMRQAISKEMMRIEDAGYAFWAPRKIKGEPKSYGDYRLLEDAGALRARLLNGDFKQHDVFLYRK